MKVEAEPLTAVRPIGAEGFAPVDELIACQVLSPRR
jgi:hypothetical protein